jgi:hypothetical protein
MDGKYTKNPNTSNTILFLFTGRIDFYALFSVVRAFALNTSDEILIKHYLHFVI